MKHSAFTLARTTEEENDHVFTPNVLHQSVLFTLLMVSLLFFVTFLAFLPAWKQGAPPSLFFTLLRDMLPALGFTSLLCLTMPYLNRVRVNESGVINGFAGVNSIHMSWAEMETVMQVRQSGVTYLKVTSFKAKSAPLFLPLSLTRSEKFRRVVVESASSINPLRQSIENGDDEAQRIKLPLA